MMPQKTPRCGRYNQLDSDLNLTSVPMGLPCGSDGKESACNAGTPRFNPWVRKILWGREWQSAPAFLFGEFHGQRSLANYSPWGHKESDMTEQLSTHTSVTLTTFQMLKSHIRLVPTYHIGQHRHRTSQVASVVSDSLRPCGL